MYFRNLILFVSLLLLAGCSGESTLSKSDSTKANTATEIATDDSLAKIEADFQVAISSWVADRNRQRTEPAPGVEFVGRCLKVAQTSADPDESGAAYAMALRHADNKTEQFETILKTLFDTYRDNECMANVARTLSLGPSRARMEQLELLIAKSPFKSVRGVACYSKAETLEKIVRLQSRPEDLESKKFEEHFGSVVTQFIRETKVEDSQLEELYVAMKQFGGVTVDQFEDVGQAGEARLFELKHLRVDCVAPEIEGEDIGGGEFKLSDYRGKVVMLDFWGDW